MQICAALKEFIPNKTAGRNKVKPAAASWLMPLTILVNGDLIYMFMAICVLTSAI